jgi:adenosine/AMP kinase
MIDLAVENAKNLGAGHSLLIFLKNVYPVNVLNRLKQVSEICRIFCATANSVEVVVAKTEQGTGILGVIDGEPPLGVENDEDKENRKSLLKKFGYKL